MDTPPGWYADPAAPRTLRWWDGRQWTEHTQPVQAANPYAGGPAAAPSGPTTEDGEPLAGWWWRVLALVIDLVILVVPSTILTWSTQQEMQRQQEALQRDFDRSVQSGEDADLGAFFTDLIDSYADHALVIFGVPLLLTVVYHAGFLRWQGRTPGKMVCGLRVRLREQPGPLPWSAIAGRLLAQPVAPNLLYAGALLTRSPAIAFLAIFVLLAYTLTDVLMAAGQRKQALHDRVAGTVVVRTRP